MHPSTDHTILDQKQLEVDRLTLIFSHLQIDNVDECWLCEGTHHNVVVDYRRELYFNLYGPRARQYRMRASCGNNNCVSPWHVRLWSQVTGQTKVYRYQHPEVEDRDALLRWYAAGNSPIRAIDVEHAQAILQAAGIHLRPKQRRPRIPQ